MAEARELIEIRQRLALLETRLEQVFEHLDIAPRAAASGGGGWWGAGEESEEQIDPTAEAEIQDLVAKGNDVVAIKRYRELTGLGLKEAKAAIDRLRG
jgi:large subunit ribosomal protein L7/L12